MSILQKLTEGVQSRDMSAEGAALLNKWEATGLLEGLNEGLAKQGMAVLLENQAKELLREASSMAAGDVEGFAAVAFPIVRRVFGGLIANDLVSVQPMSLPSGLIFFLDFTHERSRAGAEAGESIFGGNAVGRQLTGGVDLSGITTGGPGGHYALGTGYSSPTASIALGDGGATALADMSAGECADASRTDGILATPVAIGSLTDAQKKAIRFDPDVLADTSTKKVAVAVVKLSEADMQKVNVAALHACLLKDDDYTPLADGGGDLQVIRRLTEQGYRNSDGNIVAGSRAQHISFVTLGGSSSDNELAADVTLEYPLADRFAAANQGNLDQLGAIVGQDNWGLEEPKDGTGNNGSGTGKNDIAEIDIKVDSIAVTAVTKKLKAKWSPELGQDLNAYHNLDAEVELTGILSEQIALEIDRELLGELVNGATAGTRYWSRAPGLFVDSSGSELGATSASPDFTGTVSEWYETLIETINDVSAQIHRKTLRGGANFVVCSPEVANILEFTSGFRASVTADQDRGTIGAVKAGSLSKKFDVYVDPYFVRNVVLVGRKGSSFLESGFVYAPYVPLQVTPTIFGTEDFVPRKGVMTRYAKKMVRPDMYGLVVVRGLLGEAGAS